MCGRFTVTQPGQLALRFDLADNVTLDPRYNVAPAQEVPAIRQTAAGRVLETMRWGYQPAWAAGPRRPAPINARAETLAERPFFRQALGLRRCLIPADGFYEWQDAGRRARQPIYFRLRDHQLFAFAGLYAEGTPDAGPGCAIITTTPNALVAPVHDRMPAILRREDEALWLDPTLTEAEVVLHLLQPYPEELMEAYPVAALVSSVRNDGPELLRPLAAAISA